MATEKYRGFTKGTNKNKKQSVVCDASCSKRVIAPGEEVWSLRLPEEHRSVRRNTLNACSKPCVDTIDYQETCMMAENPRHPRTYAKAQRQLI